MAGHDKVTAQGKRFLKELQKLSEKQVRVGLKRGKKGKRHNGTSSQTDLVDIALYNELGTSTIPARPFFAQTVQVHEEEIREAAVSEGAARKRKGAAGFSGDRNRCAKKGTKTH